MLGYFGDKKNKFKILGYRKLTNCSFLDKHIDKHPKIYSVLNALSIITAILLFVILFATLGFAGYSAYKTKYQIPMQSFLIILPIQTNQSIDFMNYTALVNKIQNQEPIEGKYYVYLPIIYFLPGLLLTMIIHEFGHAMIMRKFKVKIKSVGVGVISFLKIPLPLFVAYVEQDDKSFKASSKFAQVSVASAGVFMNVLFFLFMMIVISILKYMKLYVVGYLVNLIWLLTILNFVVAISNVLPIFFKKEGFDGGVIINSLLGKTASVITTIISFALITSPIWGAWI